MLPEATRQTLAVRIRAHVQECWLTKANQLTAACRRSWNITIIMSSPGRRWDLQGPPPPGISAKISAGIITRASRLASRRRGGAARFSKTRRIVSLNLERTAEARFNRDRRAEYLASHVKVSHNVCRLWTTVRTVIWLGTRPTRYGIDRCIPTIPGIPHCAF